jgi:hypothetical protein
LDGLAAGSQPRGERRQKAEPPSPFHLPLLVGNLADVDTLRHLELKHSHLSKAGLWRFADKNVDEKTRDERLQFWKEDIRGLQADNPQWMTQWLMSYGTSGLKALSDTQPAALLGVPPDACRRDVFRDQSYRDPVHARLSPARAAYA